MNNKINLENILEISEITLSGCGTKRTQQTSITIFKKLDEEKKEKKDRENTKLIPEKTA